MTKLIEKTKDSQTSMREVLSLAIPIVLSMLSISMMGVIDTFFMGMIGPKEQAAVGISSPLFFAFSAFFFGLWSGVSTFVAQAFGAKKFAEAGRIIWLALLLCVPSSAIVFAVILPFSQDVLLLFNVNSTLIADSETYLFIRTLSIPVIFAMFVYESFLRGIGDMKVTAVVTTLSIPLNIVFTYFLAFGVEPLIPPLGVAGAAIGTALTQFVQMFGYAIVVYGRKYAEKFDTRIFVLPTREKIRQFLKIGAPIGASWMLEQAGWTYLTLTVGTLAQTAVAAHTIMHQLMGVAFMPGIAISIACSTLVGQYLGAQNPNAAEQAAKKSIILAVILLSSLGILLLLARVPITAFFTDDPTVSSIAYNLFWFGAIYQCFDALGIVSSGVLRGAGETRLPMYAGIILIWAILVPSIWVVMHYFDGNLYLLWCCATGFIILSGLTFFALFKLSNWQQKAIYTPT